MNTKIEIPSTAVATTVVSTEYDAQLTKLRDEMKALNARRVAALPKLAVEEREFLCDMEKSVERTETASKKASELRKNRQLSDEDRDQLAAAKVDHVKEINSKARKAEGMKFLRQAVWQSYKLTHRKDGRLGVAVRGII